MVTRKILIGVVSIFIITFAPQSDIKAKSGCDVATNKRCTTHSQCTNQVCQDWCINGDPQSGHL